MNTTETQLLAVPAELEKAVSQTSLAPADAQSLRVAFTPHFAAFDALAIEASQIAVNAPKAARAMRLKLRAIRIAADKTRKELKEDSLRRGKAIDGINAILEFQLGPVEDAMDRIEKAEEIAEQQRRDALKVERSALLAPYQDPSLLSLGDMPALAWDALFSGAKATHQAKIEAEKKAEAERIEKEKAEAAERERIRAENERLKAEVIAREEESRKERERVAAERAEAERLAKAERDAIEAKAKAERESAAKEAARVKAETEAAIRKQQEQARKEREEAEAVAKKEREAREKIEAEQRAAAKAQADRLAAEKAAAKKAAAAPDKEKLLALADLIRSVEIPSLTSDQGQAVLPVLKAQHAKYADWITEKANAI